MDLRKDYKNLLTNAKTPKPSAGLFERIINAIKREQELRQTKRLLFEFAILLIVSLAATPFSLYLLINQIKVSGILYFISTAITNFGSSFGLWKEFALAILESLPVTGILAFTISIGIALFTLRLFLYKKRLLLNYLFKQQAIINN